MRLLINNLTNANNTTVVNEQTAFPVENIFSQALIDKCYVESVLNIDFGTIVSVDSFSLFWTGDANITLWIVTGKRCLFINNSSIISIC